MPTAIRNRVRIKSWSLGCANPTGSCVKWKTFYSKENMIRILSRWNHSPRNYWNLMSIFFWYKNAAVIEREHPMIAGFFRLKSRLSRRPGYAIDPLPVHL